MLKTFRSKVSPKRLVQEDTHSVCTVVAATEDDISQDEEPNGSHQESVNKLDHDRQYTGSENNTTTDAVSSTPKIKNKSVSFGTLHVREFPVVMGDNPSVQFGGPPIRLEYDQGEEDYAEIHIDEYEATRGERRSVGELRVPASLRRKWVGRNPYLERQVFRTQCQRRRTAAKTEWDEWHYALERINRGIKKKFQFQSKPQCSADQWCQQYKLGRTIQVKEDTASTTGKQQFLLVCNKPRKSERHCSVGKKNCRVQDISTFFV